MTTGQGDSRRRARTSAGVAGAALLVLAVVLGTTALLRTAGRDDAVPTPPAPSASSTGDRPQAGGDDGPGRAAAPARVRELGYSRPVRLRIPAIDVDSPLVELGLDPSGSMETPAEVEKAGWFRPSPPPGVPGATVLAGHVTWDRRPVVFFELGRLRPGDRVEVTRADGAVTVFEVTRIGSFPKDAFPTDEVYDQPDRSELRLITCGGEYDAAARRYLDNVIVWARIVAVRT